MPDPTIPPPDPAHPPDRELSLTRFRLHHPGARLQHGGLDNRCIGDGKYVFWCPSCKRWCCECCNSGDTELCDECWCTHAKFTGVPVPRRVDPLLLPVYRGLFRFIWIAWIASLVFFLVGLLWSFLR